MRSFLAVSKTQNMHQASKNIGVSPSSLSKAIRRLEQELQVKLFKRVGRNIELTKDGLYLKSKAHEFLKFDQDIKNHLKAQEASFRVVIGASEALLSSYGVDLAQSIVQKYPLARVQFENMQSDELKKRIRDGEIDLGITTDDIPARFDHKVISTIYFQTFISKKHALYRKAKKQALPIEQVLEHTFVIPHSNLYGKITKSDSYDGWRDDKFPRKVSYFTSSLKTIENLVQEGLGIAYLPKPIGEQMGLFALDISGCPYECKQKVHLFARDKKSSGWLNQLF